MVKVVGMSKALQSQLQLSVGGGLSGVYAGLKWSQDKMVLP